MEHFQKPIYDAFKQTSKMALFEKVVIVEFSVFIVVAIAEGLKLLNDFVLDVRQGNKYATNFITI